MKILVGGSHGFIGNPLVERLQKDGHEVLRLVRPGQEQNDETILWNPSKGEINMPALEGINAVIHLGGVSIGERRWTESMKQQLWDSRILSTETLAHAIAQLNYKPSVFICASAVGYYGSQGDESLDESSPQGAGFLASLCAMWEDATSPASQAGVRVVNLRSGVVLDPSGGALAKQLPIFRSFAGGPLSWGAHWMPWISLHDEIEAIVWILNHSSLAGPVNVTSPNPVLNREFTFALSRAISRPAIIPTPRFLLKLVMGRDLTDEVLLTSQRVYPHKLLESGFAFQDLEIEDTLHTMLAPPPDEPDPQDTQKNDVSDEAPRNAWSPEQTRYRPEQNN